MTHKNNRTNSPRQPKPASAPRVKLAANFANRINANYGAYYANSGRNASYTTSGGSRALNLPGSAGDTYAGRYGERLGEQQRKKYPNRRRKIITGKELTTPLRRRTKAVVAVKQERINIRITTISAKKKKLPVSVIFGILICSFFLACLICTQIVLNEKNVKINSLHDNIDAEITKEKILTMQINEKNDLNYIINYAENNLGAVKEDLLQKYYIYSKSEDKAEVIGGGEKNNIINSLPNIISSIIP